MGRKDYTTVNIPQKLAERIDKYIKEHPEDGYSGRAELVKDLVRNFLREQERMESVYEEDTTKNND